MYKPTAIDGSFLVCTMYVGCIRSMYVTSSQSDSILSSCLTGTLRENKSTMTCTYVFYVCIILVLGLLLQSHLSYRQNVEDEMAMLDLDLWEWILILLRTKVCFREKAQKQVDLHCITIIDFLALCK